MRYSPVVLGTLLIVACSNQETPLNKGKISAATVLPTLPALDASSSTSNEAKDAMTSSPRCPKDTVFVEGLYCSNVEQKCLRWSDKDVTPKANSGIGPMRCQEFEKPSKCIGTKTRKIFCIDRFEWPNRRGEAPDVSVDWHFAKKSCEDLGKRLCTANEWTFACEGETSKPYPYGDGYHRDDTACNIDKLSMNPSTPRSEWPKHYRGVPSGSMAGCVSPFGVYDMTGNVDEWVNNEGGSMTQQPYVSGLKGGYWGPVRTRCRPMTDVHSPEHSFYQNGFRCCANAK